MSSKKIKVLIVEDSSMIVERLYPLLAEINFIYSIAHAKNGEEALTLLKILNPELILLDIKMPGMTGIEVLRKIKESQLNTNVVMLTSHADDQYKKICLDLGAKHFLSKTTDLDQIGHLIQSMELDFIVN